jgi:hypothetical protein
MPINTLHPKTTAVLDLKLNFKDHSSTGKSLLKEFDYVTDMEYSDAKGNPLFTIPYQAEQLLEQAVYLIRLANHCVENNTNIQY